jgi:imidazole glycerol phosphate synthase glutamine amidotransferase subunit
VICVIDYGAGNLRSVTNVLDVIGAEYKLVNDEAAIRAATKIVLPGVGHFGQLAAALDQLKIRHALIDQIKNGVAYLGICLGMQVLFGDSHEASTAKGLGILSGSVRKFESADRSVHMGWNTLEVTAPSRLVKPLPTDSPIDSELFAYYAHSYFCPVVDETVMTTSYGDQFSAVIEFENIFGVQFHPEKSGDFGRRVMQNFVGI